MGKLGGASMFFFVVLGFLLLGGYFVISRIKAWFGRGKNKVEMSSRLENLFNQLKREGFFHSSDLPQLITNRIISEALSECSKHEGFFWGIANRDIFIKENRPGEAYDSLLVYGNNRIGFNWRGRL
jgi:hypothetical protein